MFILTTIESDIRVHPKDLNKPPLVAVTDVIEQQYLDKVIPDLGLPVTIYDVQNIGGCNCWEVDHFDHNSYEAAGPVAKQQ